MTYFDTQLYFDAAAFNYISTNTHTNTQTVIELEEPLDLGASLDLISAFNKYGDIEKQLWEEVGQDLLRGTLSTPSDAKFKETFVLGKTFVLDKTFVLGKSDRTGSLKVNNQE